MALTADQINSLYQKVLGRDADPLGMQVQMNAGLDESTLETNLRNSAEAQKAATPTPTATVPPPPPPTSAIMPVVTTSTPGLTSQQIDASYQRILGRAADPLGMQVQMNAGLTQAQLDQNLLNSDEFKNRNKTPAAATALPAYQQRDEGVASRVADITSTNSPVMAQARAAGERSAAARGLQNSSIAGQAGEQAVISAAVPIASQEAAQASSANLSNQGFMQQAALQQTDIGAAQTRLDSSNASQERIANMQASTQTLLKNLDTQSAERIAAINVTSHDKQYAISTAAALEQTYYQAFTQIQNNVDLPADARNAALQHIAKMRDDNFSLVEQMYGIDLTWTSAVTNDTTAPPAITPGVTLTPPI